jgi:PAS domain-containing protein
LLLAIPPLLTSFLIFTNNLHQWMWLDFTLVRGEVQSIRGIGIWILTFFGFILSLVALFVFSRLCVRSRLHRWPAAICLIGLIVSRAAYIVDIAGQSPFAPVGLGTLSIIFLAVMYAIALFRYRMFNLIPIAREAMIEQMREGLLVLDSQRWIVDLNPMTATMLRLSESQIKGHQIADILPGYPDLYVSLDGSGTTPNEITFGAGSESRYYVLSTSNLKNRRGIDVGRMLLLRDVTGRKQAEAALRESEEKLRFVYDNAFDGISIYEEFPGKRVRKFLECNERYAQMGGRSMAELVEVGDTMLVQKPLALALRQTAPRT